MFKRFAGDRCFHQCYWFYFSVKPIWSLERVFFGKTLNKAWDQNIFHWLLTKIYCSIVCIASVYYVQEDCNTRLYETLSNICIYIYMYIYIHTHKLCTSCTKSCKSLYVLFYIYINCIPIQTNQPAWLNNSVKTLAKWMIL